MTKLIAVVLETPIGVLLEMPDHFCQSCGMPIADPADQGTEADGTPSDDYCGHCYRDGGFAYSPDLDDMIEGCAPLPREGHGNGPRRGRLPHGRNAAEPEAVEKGLPGG